MPRSVEVCPRARGACMQFTRSLSLAFLGAASAVVVGRGSDAGHAALTSRTGAAASIGAPIWLTGPMPDGLKRRAAAADPGWTALSAHCDSLSGGTVNLPSGQAYPDAPNVGAGYDGESYLPEVLALGLCYRTAAGTDDASANRWAQAGTRVLAAMATPASAGGETPSKDEGYAIRNYAVGMPAGYDWLSPSLDDATRPAVTTALDTWVGWYDPSGCSTNEPIGN